jgi:hypothetical protein
MIITAIICIYLIVLGFVLTQELSFAAKVGILVIAPLVLPILIGALIGLTIDAEYNIIEGKADD